MNTELKLKYVTYQTFPSQKANTLQTIGNLDYLSKNGLNVTLIFPLREAESSSDVSLLKKIYGHESNIKFVGTPHKLPFGKINNLVKLLFLTSHYLWSKKIVSSIKNSPEKDIVYFTRSEWVFYYLSKYGFHVIYECHQLSKLKKILIPISIKNQKSKIIFLNDELRTDLNIAQKYSAKIRVLHNGVDKKNFRDGVIKDKKRIIFSGNLTRFNSSRNLDFILEAFLDERLAGYSLYIVGASEDEYSLLLKSIKKLGLSEKIKVKKWLNRKQSIMEIQKSSIGILINSNNNLHSTKYTSPLKYFEYLFAGLSIVAVDFKAHRILPYSENINFFDLNNKNEFIEAILSSTKKTKIDKGKITLDFRSKEIIKFISC
jgi:hypothetical protein